MRSDRKSLAAGDGEALLSLGREIGPGQQGAAGADRAGTGAELGEQQKS